MFFSFQYINGEENHIRLLERNLAPSLSFFSGASKLISMRRRRLVLILVCIGVLSLVVLVGLGVWLERWGRIERARPSDAIVIFGAKVRADGSASLLLQGRTRHAYALWKRGLAPVIVCTGGVGEFPPAESVLESHLLENWGVPSSAILREERSTSTRENALFGARLLPRGARVIGVSDPFHLFRCRRDLQLAGLRATTSPALDQWDALPLLSRLFYCVRESVSLLRDFVLS